MKTTTAAFIKFESTYAMLLRSEEKERSASETAIYILLILSAAFAFLQIMAQPFTVPTNFVQDVPGRPAAAISTARA